MRSYILAFAVAVSLVACSFPDEAPVTPTPTPVIAPASEPTPRPVVIIPAAEPWCPYKPVEQLRLTESQPGVFQISFDVAKEPSTGVYLHRYQIAIQRFANHFLTLEAEITRLTGPHDRRAVVEWIAPYSGAYAVAVRAWFPNSCHDDGSGNLRLNGEWTGFVGNES